MANENDKVDIEIPEDVNLADLDDSTDWKSTAEELQRKHREAGIRNRERTKTLRDQLAERDAKVTELLAGKTTEENRQPNADSQLLKKIEKITLRSAGITDEDEVNLALTTAKKWGMDLEEVVGDEDFKTKLDKLRITKANADATSRIRGGKGGKNNDLESFNQRFKETGELPQTTDKKLLAEFTRGQIQAGKVGKKFYND